MKTKDYVFYGIIVAFIVLFLASAVLFKVFNVDILPAQFYGALIGVFITAIVTAFLLRGQTEGDEKREKSVKVFEKKQEVYHNFLAKLKEIIQDGEIQIGTKNDDGSLDSSVDELKDLIFQFAYLQLHTSEDTINGVLEKVSKLIQHLNDFGSTQEADKQKALPEFYSSLSDEIFGIAAILKKDLYDADCKPISKEKMTKILRECELFVETNDFDKYEIQKYFFDELIRLLTQKGYNIKEKEYDFTQDIMLFYARARNRHRWYGFSFPVYKSKKMNKEISWELQLGNEYYYGIPRTNEGFENSDISNCIPAGFKSNTWWYAWKYSDNYRLDFWNLNSSGFEQLKNPRKREVFMQGVANEIDMWVKNFVQMAEKNNL
jgi:hypothetical protein